MMAPPSRASQVIGSIERALQTCPPRAWPKRPLHARFRANISQTAVRNKNASNGRCAQAREHGQADAAQARATSWQSGRGGLRPAQPPLSAPRHARKLAAERRKRIDDHRKLHENNGIQSEIVMYDDSSAVEKRVESYRRIRSLLAISPMMPRRNRSTQATKIAPWMTSTHSPIGASLNCISRIT